MCKYIEFSPPTHFINAFKIFFKIDFYILMSITEKCKILLIFQLMSRSNNKIKTFILNKRLCTTEISIRLSKLDTAQQRQIFRTF